MIYFFINIIMLFIINLIYAYYFKDKINIFTFIIIIFNMNISFFFIYNNINFIYFFLISLLFLILYRLFNFRLEEEKIIIKDGNIIFHELINSYSYFRLINYLKFHHIKLDEIKYLVKKGDKIVVIRNKFHSSYPVSIILDGKIQEENLYLIKRNTEWLEKELINKKLILKNINYAYYLKNKIYFIQN